MLHLVLYRKDLYNT